MKCLVAFVLMPIVFPVLQAQQATGPGSPARTNQKLEEPAPIAVAPEPTDPVERALRATRDRLFNSPIEIPFGQFEPIKRNRLDTMPPRPPNVVFVDRAPAPPNTRPEDYQLPVVDSDTIILGSLSTAQPYLSEDGTSLYTEYTISVEQVIKDSANLTLKAGSIVALFRMGGALRLAFGRVIRLDVHGLDDPPVKGHRYVWFLNYDARGYWFRAVKLWEMRDSGAAPMDPFDQGLANAGRSQHTGMSEADFLNAVRDEVQRIGVKK